MTEEKQKKKKRVWILIGLTVLLAGVLLAVLLLRNRNSGKQPTLSVSDARADEIEAEAIAELSVNCLGDAAYPAASFVIEFDKTRLELLAVEEGNVILSSGGKDCVPNWNVDVSYANSTGTVKIMYLDITGGSCAFTKDCIEENNILCRLRFRVRGTAKAGEVYRLNVLDAVFAANDEAESLAMSAKTLTVKDGSIVIGVGK